MGMPVASNILQRLTLTERWIRSFKLTQRMDRLFLYTLSTSMIPRSTLLSHTKPVRYSSGLNTTTNDSLSANNELREELDDSSMNHESDISSERLEPPHESMTSLSGDQTHPELDSIARQEASEVPSETMSMDQKSRQRHHGAIENNPDKVDQVVSSVGVGHQEIVSRYHPGIVRCTVASYPNYEVYLCGTVHVSKSSVNMVKDVIQTLRPEFVLVELCAERADSLCSLLDAKPVTLRDILREAYHERSLSPLWVGMLSWYVII